MKPELRNLISEMYKAAANEVTERRFFEVPSLADVIDKYKSEYG